MIGISNNCKLCGKTLDAKERLAMFFAYTDEEPKKLIIPICYRCYKLPVGTEIKYD